MTLSKVEYNTIHKWNLRHWKKTGICEHCGEAKKTQWSNKSGLYKRARYDWQELCVRCHNLFDAKFLGRKTGPKSKLTDQQKEEIRSQHLAGVSQTQLARNYKVSKQVVWWLLNNYKRANSNSPAEP